MDWGILPPEVNSGRMWAGPGIGSHIAAIAAWTAVSDSLFATAASYRSTLTDLATTWTGPSSINAVASGLTYALWLEMTAAQAAQTATKLFAAVAAFEIAFAAHVPPPVIAANRALLMALIATNFLGINTPAIMATEAHYVEMWAQDAAAMFAYHAGSMSAANVPLFQSAARTANPAGLLSGLNIFAPGSNQSTAGLAGLLNLFSGSTNSSFGSFLNGNLISTGGVNSGSNILGNAASALPGFAGLGTAGQANNISQQQLDTQKQQNGIPTDPVPPYTPPNGQPVSPVPTAQTASASRVGKLSVPQSWAQQVAAKTPGTTPVTPLETTPQQAAATGYGAPGMYGAPGSKSFGPTPRYGRKITVMPSQVF
jgi:PPE-repeat protein